MSKLIPLIALGLMLSAGHAGAATVTIVNTNDPGVGFNDPSIVANTDAGCVVGETLGACRLRVFTTAANQWGRLLSSNVEIRVQARMIPQTCSGTSAVLGSAGPIGAFSNFPNAPRAGTFYPSALANALAGSDLDPTADDITTNFNVSIDTGCLTGIVGWWYGVNPSVPAPANRSALLPVVFHEIGHGLGFTALVNTTTGAYFTPGPSIWAHFLYDTETNQRWLDMNNAQRQASAINDPDLVWSGRQVSIAAPRFLRSPARVLVTAPAGIAGSYEAQTASFGPDVGNPPVTADVVLVNDGVSGSGSPAGTPTDGCETPFVNAAAVAGKIALIDRGFCPFVQKVLNAQAAGAIGVIIANNTTPGLPGMGGTSVAVTIPSLGVTQDLGNAMKANLPSPGVTASLTTDPTLPLAGTRFNCVRMFAPNPVQSGSSVSHFHSEAFPNLLMEPALTGTIFDRVDLTADLFRDIGWTVAGDDVFFAENFEDGPCAFAP
jgi:hypothetical protein